MGFLHPLERNAIVANKVNKIFNVFQVHPLTGELNDTTFIWRFDTSGNFISGGNGWYHETYQYDSLNRVIIEELGSCITQPDSFKYQQISDQQLLRLGVLGDSAWINFNRQGLPIRSFVKKGRHQTTTTTFIYDEQGYLTRRITENTYNPEQFDAYMINTSGVCHDSFTYFQQEFFIINRKLEKTVSDFRCITQGDTFKMSMVYQFDSSGLRDYLVRDGKEVYFQHIR
ncbi:MAG TPA: hypothetical protein PK228_08210 [Saprospiraceae bacterium]|nr:hypothetical protein [Saprospiraceae bacterium]